jgi:hypothetical protein
MADSNWDHGESAEPAVTSIIVVNDPPVDASNSNEMSETALPQLSIDKISHQAVDYCIAQDLSDPVEILRYYQSVFVTRRQLDISNPTAVTEGATNYILVDRGDILSTAFDEVKEIEDLRMTYRFNFITRSAIFLSGRIKNWRSHNIRKILMIENWDKANFFWKVLSKVYVIRGGRKGGMETAKPHRKT